MISRASPAVAFFAFATNPPRSTFSSPGGPQPPPIAFRRTTARCGFSRLETHETPGGPNAKAILVVDAHLRQIVRVVERGVFQSIIAAGRPAVSRRVEVHFED